MGDCDIDMLAFDDGDDDDVQSRCCFFPPLIPTVQPEALNFSGSIVF